MDSHLGDLKLVTDGASVFSVGAQDGELLDALRDGQLAFFVEIGEIARKVEDDVTRFELDRDRFLDLLRASEDDVIEEVRSAARG